MTLFGRIRPLYFFAAFAAGLMICYAITPAPRVVLKFPTPYNDSTVYMDGASTCYKYAAEKVACPIDKASIRAQPIGDVAPPPSA